MVFDFMAFLLSMKTSTKRQPFNPSQMQRQNNKITQKQEEEEEKSKGIERGEDIK